MHEVSLQHYNFAAQLVQGALLIGVRRRVWLWFGLAIISNPNISGIEELLRVAYQKFFSVVSAFVPAVYIMPIYVVVAFSLQIAFGALAAFFMPPLVKENAAFRPH